MLNNKNYNIEDIEIYEFITLADDDPIRQFLIDKGLGVGIIIPAN